MDGMSSKTTSKSSRSASTTGGRLSRFASSASSAGRIAMPAVAEGWECVTIPTLEHHLADFLRKNEPTSVHFQNDGYFQSGNAVY